jgi:predicted RNase H-like nuclease
MYLRITVKTSFRDTSVVDIVLGRYWLVDWRRRVTCNPQHSRTLDDVYDEMDALVCHVAALF